MSLPLGFTLGFTLEFKMTPAFRLKWIAWALIQNTKYLSSSLPLGKSLYGKNEMKWNEMKWSSMQCNWMNEWMNAMEWKLEEKGS